MNLTANDTKTSLKEELRIIPRIAWAVAAIFILLWLTVVLPLIVQTVPAQPNRFGGGPERVAIIPVFCFVGLIFTIWLLLIFYVNADTRRRGMSRLVWTLLVLFVPYGIGFIVYYVARRPIQQPCSKCGTLLHSDFIFCPHCSQELKPRCPGCRHTVGAGWINCAYCGAKLS